ncbi:MAG: ribonuclease III [Oligoflexia bacterium]|nr:ribonuclease III [Oligoflexia bacterium]
MKPLEKLTKYKIKDQKLFKQAFTHKSFTKSKNNNERLEFLGDALLDFFVADLLFKNYLQDEEGELTKKRSQWVSGASLAKIARDLKLNNYLQVGEERFKNNSRILAGALEAYIGAVYLDSGMTAVKKLVKHLFEEKIKQSPIDTNYKSLLQEWCQKKYKQVPIYKIKEEKGVEHNKVFSIEVFIQNKSCGEGDSHQKKQAEQVAAKQALKKLKII